MMATQSKADPLRAGQDRDKRHSMDIKQILLFGLFLVPVCSSRCYEAGELEDVVKRRLKTVHPQPLSADSSTGANPGSPFSCPVELYRHQPRQSDVSLRSLSPWRYVRVTMEDHFPSTYMEAQCLCTGCILIQDRPGREPLPHESSDYNSKPLKQSRWFLKRERCEGKQTYQLTLVPVEVAVGCTCVKATTSSS